MAEAKLQLGALHTVETTFRNEFDVYSNNLRHIGFDLSSEDNVSQFHFGNYSVGFFQNDKCVDAMAVGPTDSLAKARLEERHPQFYSTGWVHLLRYGIGGPASAYCLSGQLDALGMSFLATSNGVISNGNFISAPLSDTDVWSINEKRELIHVHDG